MMREAEGREAHESASKAGGRVRPGARGKDEVSVRDIGVCGADGAHHLEVKRGPAGRDLGTESRSMNSAAAGIALETPATTTVSLPILEGKLSPPRGVSSVEDADGVPRQRDMSAADRKLRIVNLCAVIIPFLGLIAAVALLWGVALDWTQVAIAVGMFLVTGFGITVGFHRLCTHRSFETPAWLRYAFAAAGSMAVQGPVIEWCGAHRRHHQHSDTEEDPHSPHMGPNGSWGEGVMATLRGGLHAHLGWLLTGRQKGLGKYTRDLHEDRAIAAADRHFKFWVFAGLIIPAVLGGLIEQSWTGALLGFLWGGLVRVLFVHHVTWSVNSVCHLWGTRPFVAHDESRNNAIVGILGLGEGWHNNHHAFPTSARHGLRWWEIDTSYWVIKVLAFVGLARKVRVPDAQRLESKKTRRSER